MRKFFPIVIVLVLAVLLSGCDLLQKKEESTGESTSSTKESTTKEEGYSGTLEKMMGLGLPLKCTWKRDENYHGISYLKGKKSYGEVTAQGKTAKVIFKDDCMWNWEEGNAQGIKMCFEPSEAEEVSGEGVSEGGDWADKEKMQPSDIEYNCRPAVITDDKFNPPGDVQFMDMEEMMEGMGR